MAKMAPARRAELESLAAEFLQNYSRGRLIVAIDGPDASGKTRFADDFATVLRKGGHEVARASIDDFHRPSAARHARGRDSAEGYYKDGYNYSVFRRVLVEPFRLAGSTAFVTAAFDYIRDVQIEPKWQTGPLDLILVLDGVFLNRPELHGLWNFSIWLDADPAVRAERLRKRDGIEPGSARADRYLGAQDLYEADAHPRDRVSAVIDNTDPDHPRRVFADSC